MTGPGECPRCRGTAKWGKITDENDLMTGAWVLYCENCNAMVKIQSDPDNNPFRDERAI